MTSEFAIPEELIRFINENTSDGYSLQIILFFADHPYTQFNELAIIHALSQDGERRYLQKALKALVGKGLIKTRTDSNAIVYSLPENMRPLASELAKFDVYQRQLLLRQTSPDPVRKGRLWFRDMAADMLSQIPGTAAISGRNATIFNPEERHRY